MKYEYLKIVTTEDAHFEQVQQAGADGWELIGVTRSDLQMIIYFFKRPLK